MKNIKQLSAKFRQAIITACANGAFDKDEVFRNFPHGCCGDTCDLLAEFLSKSGILTYYVCGMYENGEPEIWQTHAWLKTDKDIIIDITGDQFKDNSCFLNYNIPVYVGYSDEFHNMFEVQPEDIRENVDFNLTGEFWRYRLKCLYDVIINYIE